MEIGKFKLAKADLVRPPKKPIQEQIIPKEKPYTKEVFQTEVEPFIKGFIGGFPKNEMTMKLQSILDKAVEKGALTTEEGVGYMRNRKQQLLDFVEQNPGETLPEFGRENFSVGSGVRSGPKSSGDMEGALKYLKTLKPGTPVNTYAIGKQFNVAPASVAGQVQRNFPELKLQTRKESAVKATETRKELYKQKQSDVPVVETKIRGSGKEARGKGRDITGIRFPNEQMKKDYIQDLTNRYSDVKGRKGLTNKELAKKYLGSSNPNDIGRIERINNFFVKDLNLEYKKAPVSETREKRTRRLDIVQGGRSLKGTDKVPFHHIMNIGGEVPLTTKDVTFITKKMNSTLSQYNTKLNDIADAISNQLNNQEPGYLKRISELNNQAEQIIESAKTKLPKKYQGYIGFNRLDPILDEYGTPIRLDVKRVGVDDAKSLAGKKGAAIPLETLVQSKLDELKKNKKGGVMLGSAGDLDTAARLLKEDFQKARRLFGPAAGKIAQMGLRGASTVLPFEGLFIGDYQQQGYSPKEIAMNLPTLGLGTFLKDQQEKADFVRSRGYGDALESALKKEKISQQARPVQGAPEGIFAAQALTDDEQRALRMFEIDAQNIINMRRDYQAGEYEKLDKAFGADDPIMRTGAMNGGIMRTGFVAGGLAALFKKAAQVSNKLRNLKNSVFENFNNVRMFGEQEGVAKNLQSYTNIPNKNRKTSTLEDIENLKLELPEKYHADLDILKNATEQNNFKTAFKQYEEFEKNLDPTLKFENIPEEYFPMLDPTNEAFVITGPRESFKAPRYSFRSSMELDPKTQKPTGKYQTEKLEIFDPETRTFRKKGEEKIVGVTTDKGKEGLN